MADSADRLDMSRLALASAMRRARRNLALARVSVSGSWSRKARQLTLTPQDLRTADPTVAADIYSGHFVFAGRALSTGGGSPFLAHPPSQAWAEALHGMGWLRHLRAADTALSRANARALIDEFIRKRHDRDEIGSRPVVASRRLIALIANAGMILDGADHSYYARFIRHLEDSARRLAVDMRHGLTERDRLAAAIGCSYAWLCLDRCERLARRATARLLQELEWQILPDGGHVSRNPRLIIELLLDLLPLRVLYGSKGSEQPRGLTAAIDRMMPHLRLFRHGDGAVALFNGMGATQPDTLATLLAYDDVRGRPMTDAPYSGYARLEGGEGLLIADVGAAPGLSSSAEACAGPLAFEFSHGRQRLIVNCGLPQHAATPLRLASRYTAAHSTLALNEEDAGRFIGIGGETLLSGAARSANHERRNGEAGAVLEASHDAWASRFGVTHRRIWALSADGRMLTGRDELLGPLSRQADGLLRFHLHPTAQAAMLQDGRSALITAGQECWRFRSEALPVRIEESLFLAGPDGTRRSQQIVIPFEARADAAITWRLEYMPAHKRKAEPGEQTPSLL